ncbi:protein FAR1-RELATED SEQUENCE 5-like [Helianthus annuus]|uniref:protein FAR1-RELATED SEQUENCE 5-like n=1 Tax=Helianthus annuus TaxID=4232 RepID=UPI000B8F8E7A|nr:protein FAR1-RELATED SEQUENCE 5-like [Helianthus annuus]
MYVKYAKECGFSVRKGTTKTNSKGVLHIKYFLCTRAGVYKDKKVDTLDPNQKERVVRSNFSKRTDCGALLCVEFEDGFWKVYKFVKEHNHELVERPDKHFLPTKRHLTQLQKHVIHSMSKLNLGPVKAFNVMKTCFGGFEDVGTSKPNFSYVYITDEENRLKGHFWCNDQAKRNYHVFGDVISFDATHRSNKYSMVFVPFTGIDNHHFNVTFGAALLASETADTFVTDQDPAMKKAISVVFVDTRHRLCMWHVMHKLSLKVGVRLCNSINFKERIYGVVWTDILTPEEFESEWEVVIAEFNLEDNDWLSDIFALRESWIPAYYRMEHMSGLMRTTSRQTFYAWRYRDIVFGIFQIVAPPASSRGRFAEITGQYKNDKNPIRVPVGYKSKGSGSRKRLKSKQEIAVDKKKSKPKPGAKERQCQNCKAYGHYASTCKQAVIKRRSTRSSRASEE